jgi:trimethylamine:corrinoid methyltransferase-like protein
MPRLRFNVQASARRDNGVFMNNIRPRLSMMTEEQIEQAHRYTMRVLRETGVRVDSQYIP